MLNFIAARVIAHIAAITAHVLAASLPFRCENLVGDETTQGRRHRPHEQQQQNEGGAYPHDK